MQQVLQSLQEVLLTHSALILMGMVCIVAGSLYLTCAIHEHPRVSRQFEMIVAGVMIGGALGIVFGFSAQGGFSGALVGLTFGFGLALGTEVLLPVDWSKRTWFGHFQNAYIAISNFVSAFIVGVPLYCLGTLLLLPLVLVLGLLVCLAWLVPGIIWTIGEVLGRLFRVIGRWAKGLISKVDRSVEQVVGTGETSGVAVYLRHLLPNSSLVRWIVLGFLSLYFYFIWLMVGHIVGYVGSSLFPTMLASRADYLAAFLYAPIAGFVLGTLYFCISAETWTFGAHSKRDMEAQEFLQQDVGPLGQLIQMLTDDEERPIAVHQIHQEVAELFSPPLLGDRFKTSEEKRKQNAVRRVLLRSVLFFPLCAFIVGVADDLRFLSLSHYASVAIPSIVQRGVIVVGIYLANKIAAQMKPFWLGVFGLFILIGGIVLQAMQYPAFSNILPFLR